MKIPRCCGDEMQVNIETVKFLEVQCQGCGDVVYVKKEEIERPQMVDD